MYWELDFGDWESVVLRFDEYAIRRPVRNSLFEGTQGKSELRKLLPRDLLYNEPTWGKDTNAGCRVADDTKCQV